MGIGALNYQGVKSGIKLNDVIEEFKYVYQGQEIKAGDFVNYINGVAGQTSYGTSSDTKLVESKNAGYEISAVVLDENKVFIAHSLTSNYQLYGMVVTINGATITKGADTQLSSMGCSGYLISAELLPNGNVFIAHTYDNAYYYLYGLVCTISGTTITKGTDTQLRTTQFSGYGITTQVLENGNIFIAHRSTNSYILSGMIITISGTTITKNTDTQISSTVQLSYASCRPSSVLLENGNIFIAYPYSNNANLFGIVCSISGTTITAGTDTALGSTGGTGWRASVCVLKDGKVFIAHGYDSEDYYLYGIVCTITGKTITKGTDTKLESMTYSGYWITTQTLENGNVFIAYGAYSDERYLYGKIVSISGTTISQYSRVALPNTSTYYTGACVSSVLLRNGTVLIVHSYSTNYYLYAQVWDVDEVNIKPTNQISITEYEEQVTLATQPKFDGIALSDGVGGDDTAHNEQVKMAVPRLPQPVIKTGDIIPKSWTAIDDTNLSYVAEDGTIISADSDNIEYYEVVRAVDGNEESYFKSKEHTSSHTYGSVMIIKFPIPIKILKCIFKCSANSLSNFGYYMIQGSNDNSTWNNLTSQVSTPNNTMEPITLNNPDYYSYYMFYVSSTGTGSYVVCNEIQTTEYEVME